MMRVSAKALLAALTISACSAMSLWGQVTITGTGAGAFKCTEGGDPGIGAANTDYLWCDSSH
jgi:hypothetical protein